MPAVMDSCAHTTKTDRASDGRLLALRHIWYATQDERAALGCPSPALSSRADAENGAGACALTRQASTLTHPTPKTTVNCFLTSESIGGAVKRT